MSTSSSSYKERQLEGASLLDVIAESMFKMSFLMRHITIAIKQQKNEDIYLLSKKGLELLAVLEGMLQENEITQESLKEFIGFCEAMSVCLQQVGLDESGELADQLGETFRKIGTQFQDKQEKLERDGKNEDPS